MTEQSISYENSRVQRALMELKEMIRARFPSATFVVSRGEDPEGVYLDVLVDLDDPDQVMDLVVERLLELQVDEELPVHVVPLRTAEREAQLVASQAHAPFSRHGQAALDREA